MPWLNWSLKLHIRRRIISLLILTHNTQVYVQWMSYSFVWLYLIKCIFHILNLCWFKHKKIFECFRCFWKVFCSSKIENFKNYFCSVLVTQSWVSQVACHSRELAGQFWRLVCEWKVQSRGLLRYFRGSARDSLASETSSRKKHLENFSKLLAWSVLAGVSGDYLATYLSREKRVFCTMRTVFKIFFNFPSNFLWLFIFFLNCLLSKLSV